MIKFIKNGVIVLGISDKNVELLKEGKPIKINLNELGLEDRTVYIVHGTTEDAIVKQFKDLFDPLATIYKDSRSPNN